MLLDSSQSSVPAMVSGPAKISLRLLYNAMYCSSHDDGLDLLLSGGIWQISHRIALVTCGVVGQVH